MSKESYAAGLGKRFGPGDGTWGKTMKGRVLRRVGKTMRDKASGAWGARFQNRDSRALENRGGPKKKGAQ